jgi:ABC-type ATPase with predicted acetyltransferase domain
MDEFTISKSFSWQGTPTEKVISVCQMFGLTIDRLRERRKIHKCYLKIQQGDIVYIHGPSGSGKTVILKELEKLIPAENRINLSEIELPADKTVIECIEGSLLSCLQLLSTAGLSDCFCILNQPSNLSDGEKYRFRLAMAMATKKKYIIADEFSSELDRITAASISYRLRKFAKKTGTIFILASSHRDILFDLAPDILVTKDFSTVPAIVDYKDIRRKR